MCVLAAITTHDVPLIATIAVSLAFAFVGGLLAVRTNGDNLLGSDCRPLRSQNVFLNFADRSRKVRGEK